jgi:hypothetical protein
MSAMLAGLIPRPLTVDRNLDVLATPSYYLAAVCCLSSGMGAAVVDASPAARTMMASVAITMERDEPRQ